ncbi:regulator of G-protein signaling 14 isoform X1 [Lepisosteus oculatus]|uniref:regulator of G-protein signaling 14 isoform X1 n=1 Tax=Lepisosteus oculatus TaxID=7918 RepID=UPI0035F51D84
MLCESKEKRMIMFHELSKGFSSFTPRASLRRKFGRYNTFIINRPLNYTKTLAVSDGELNVTEGDGHGSTHSLNSNTSLPSVQSGSRRVERSVASWAVSFERLLEDPTGVRYFTAFLKSEVSAENILFWQACEKFRQIPPSQKDELLREAREIYVNYLSSNALHAINIDDTARIEESLLDNPTPDMFQKAQQQIFKLMKFDSYTRFVRSQLYQKCMLANVAGQPLPDLWPGSKSPGSRKSMINDSPSLTDSKKKKKLKAGKSLPFDVEDSSERKRATLDGRPSQDKSKRDKRREMRGSWGAELSDQRSISVSRRESQSSVTSSTSVELGSFCNKGENGSSCPRVTDQDKESRAVKYCCVYLPDGTASLAPVRADLTVRDMLSGICEKRGILLKDVKIYLKGNDKPLSLDQESLVLTDQQVLLETMITFTLEVVFLGKTVGIVAKSSKVLSEALAPVLRKNELRPEEVVATISGSQEPLNMSIPVMSLAKKKVLLDRIKGKEQNSNTKTPISPPEIQVIESSIQEEKSETPCTGRNQTRTNSRVRNPMQRRTYDMDGLIDLLSKVQNSRVNDQRGLLCKENLVIPHFLQQPLREEESEEDEDKREKLKESQLASDPSPPLAQLDSGGQDVEKQPASTTTLPECNKPVSSEDSDTGLTNDSDQSECQSKQSSQVTDTNAPSLQTKMPIVHTDSSRETTV